MPVGARSTCLRNSVPPTTSEHEKHAVLVRFSCSTCTGSIPTYKHVERARKGTLYVSSTSYHLKTRKTRRFGAFFVFCAAPYPPGHEERAVFARFSWSTFSRSNPRPQTRIMCPSGYVLRVCHLPHLRTRKMRRFGAFIVFGAILPSRQTKHALYGRVSFAWIHFLMSHLSLPSNTKNVPFSARFSCSVPPAFRTRHARRGGVGPSCPSSNKTVSS